MRKRKGFWVASFVLLMLGMVAWQCGGAAETPTPIPPTPTPIPPTPTPTPPPDQALRDYVRRTGAVMLRFVEEGEAWADTLAEVDPEAPTEEWLLGVVDTTNGLMDLLDDLRSDWSLIAPPSTVQDFHSRMAGCLDKMVSAVQRTHEAAARGDLQATWNAALDFMDILDFTFAPLAAEWEQIMDQAYLE